MPNFTLEAATPLGGYNSSFDGVSLGEVGNLAIVSIAIPLAAEKEAERKIAKAFNITLPKVGKSALTTNGKIRLLRLGRDQLFAVFLHTYPDAEQVIAKKLGGSVYTTDQTDVWVALEISGQNARSVLERICPIDLHNEAFVKDDVARTSMEHLGTIIVRTKADEFLLLSASSSAGSFLHAVETSIKNIL